VRRATGGSDRGSENGSSPYSSPYRIPANVNKQTFRFVLKNDGHLPGSSADVNMECTLMTHTHVKLKSCRAYFVFKMTGPHKFA